MGEAEDRGEFGLQENMTRRKKEEDRNRREEDNGGMTVTTKTREREMDRKAEIGIEGLGRRYEQEVER